MTAADKVVSSSSSTSAQNSPLPSSSTSKHEREIKPTQVSQNMTFGLSKDSKSSIARSKSNSSTSPSDRTATKHVLLASTPTPPPAASSQSSSDSSKAHSTGGNVFLYVMKNHLQEGPKLSKAERTELNAKFLKAVRAGSEALAEKFLKSGADINAMTEDVENETALHIACKKHGRIEMCTLLLEWGANVDAESQPYERTPLDYAMQWSLDHCKLLVERGANVKHVSLSGIENTAIFLFLVNEGADVNAVLRNEKTPLHHFASDFCASHCKILLENGAKIDSLDKYGHTPLHSAIESCKRYNNVNSAKIERCIETCRVLLHHGADINSRDEKGHTPLATLICEESRGVKLELCEFLIENGADVDTRDSKGAPLLESISSHLYTGYDEVALPVAKLLVSHGADINILTRFGRPLWKPNYAENNAVQKYLMEQSGITISAGKKIQALFGF